MKILKRYLFKNSSLGTPSFSNTAEPIYRLVISILISILIKFEIMLWTLFMYCFVNSGYLNITAIKKLAIDGTRYFISLPQLAGLFKMESVST